MGFNSAFKGLNSAKRLVLKLERFFVSYEVGTNYPNVRLTSNELLASCDDKTYCISQKYIASSLILLLAPRFMELQI